MHKLSILFAVVGFLSLNAQRYLTDEFLLLDSITAGVYGSAMDYQSNEQELLFDFYEPADDTLQERPLIIYLHGGGFNTGSRLYPSVKQICRRMANKGYTVANIDYRLDPDFDIYNSSTDRRAMTDAMHDAKQAIRYFKANAATYGIDTSLIFIGGESAGAVTAMMASFVDKQSEMSAYPMAEPNDPIGSTANSDLGNQVSATLCLCGMILDTLAIELPSDPPILWTHGSEDTFIPLSLSFNVVLRAANIGLPIQTKLYQGGVHCPWYYGNPNWDTYLDSTVVDITSFLYPQVSSGTVGIDDLDHNNGVSIYPNPFESHLNIKLDPHHSASTIKIATSSGTIVYENSYAISDNEIDLYLDYLEPGVYFLMIENGLDWTVKKVTKLW